MIRAQQLTGTAVVIGILTMVTVAACTSETPRNPPPAGDAPAKAADAVPSKDTLARLTAGMDKLSTVQLPQQGSRAAAIIRDTAKPVAEGVDPAQIFPPVGAQVPHVWVGWYVNRSIDAFRRAIDENKPLLLVVAENGCNDCMDLAYNALRCPAVDRFAGDAVFAFSFVSSDLGAKSIAGSLKFDTYPTITVLEPESRILLERGRINGYGDGTWLGGHLDTILWKTEPRVLPTNWDGGLAGLETATPGAPWTPRPGGPATIGSALSGAASRGLTHAPPAPKCR